MFAVFLKHYNFACVVYSLAKVIIDCILFFISQSFIQYHKTELFTVSQLLQMLFVHSNIDSSLIIIKSEQCTVKCAILRISLHIFATNGKFRNHFLNSCLYILQQTRVENACKNLKHVLVHQNCRIF